MKKRIYYHDTDCGGVVYYANYLKFMEEARTEFFEQHGILLKELSEKGVLFVVARQEADYKAPAVYGDIIEVTSSVEELSNVRINFGHEVYNQSGRLLVRARTVMVCVGRDLRPQAMPDDLKLALQK
ncbi:MAG: acyl-CoA thioesterase [Candidatus Omnitrophica bacterium]|nr:acyl-CoA thioesterase [Candidatus Omnitrophota bacterium]